MRRTLCALGATAAAVVPAFAINPPHRLVAPIVPCPPVVMPTAPCPPGTTPSVPGTTPGTPTTPPTTPPGTPPTPPPVVPDVSDAFARQSEGGSQASATFAPNMFGDIFGARSLRITYSARADATFPIVSQSQTSALVDPNGNGGTIVFRRLDTGTTLGTVNAAFNTGDLTYTQLLNNGGADFDRAFAQSALQSLLSAGELTQAQINSFNQLTPAERDQLIRNRGQINSAITQATGGLAVQGVTVRSVDGTLDSGFINYSAVLDGEQYVVLPGAGSTVGRVKMSEDNSPLPRDRFIFTYDHFDNVPFTTSGFTVNRFQFGIEKTFLDGRWSAEFRLPFAGTLASTSVQGFEVGHTEIGNVRFALKRIFSQNQVLTTSSGVAVTLPTADDQVLLSSFDGRELYRFQNNSVTVEPFMAALFTPNDRLFSQTWASINFDVSGGDFTWNRDVFGGSGSARIWDLPFLAVDQQVGYWLIRNDVGTLRGLAPFVELHWNYAIAQNELLREVNKRTGTQALTVGGVATHELNLSAGVITQIGDNLNMSIGASAPMLQRPDRTFDAQVGVRASYLFGRTARARNPIYYVSGY